MKQKAVIRVRAHCDKCRAKAMEVAAKEGVESVAMEGKDRDEIVVFGEDIDIACLTKRLRRKVGHANIRTVEEIDEEKIRKENEEKKRKEEEEKKKIEEKKKKEEEEARQKAEREKKELECYRKSRNPCYITPYARDCHCKGECHCKCDDPPQLECYRKSRNPCYITSYGRDCHCKGECHCKCDDPPPCIQPIQYPCYSGSQYQCYQPTAMMCTTDDPCSNNDCTIM